MSTPQEERKPLPVLKLCDKVPQFGTEPGEGALSVGDNRKDLVKRLQFMLEDLGFFLGATGPNQDGIDEVFGDLTRKAVEDFQGKNKHVDGNPLKVDGMVGPRTADALNREMVGLWFDHYPTPRELTDGEVHITVTSDRLSNGLLIETDLADEADIFLVGPVPAFVIEPLVISVFIGTTNIENTNGELLVLDDNGEEFKVVPLNDATKISNGFAFFVLDPSEFPKSIEIRWRKNDETVHLAGPCSPIDLRKALVEGDLKKADALAHPDSSLA